MTVASEITRLQSSKAAIKAAIEAKGVTVDPAVKLDGYAAKIGEITQGGGAIPNPPTPYVRPADWIDISEVGDNEINLLVTNGTGIAFRVTTSTGTYSIDWGDGTVETDRLSNTTYQHQHTTGGTWSTDGYYTWKIRIYGATGNITRFQMYRHTYTKRIQFSPVLWVNFGTNAISLYENTFYSANLFCTKLRECQILSFASNSNTSNMFQNCYSLASITLPTSWGSVTNVGSMFISCYSLASITLPDSWGSVTNVGSMFISCYSLASITLPDSWGSVTNVSYMFNYCYSLASITLPDSWGSVTNVTYMFQNCLSLASITLPDSWGSVTTVGSMFQNCYSLASITLPTSWGSVTNVTYMFNTCYSLASITLPDSWGSVKNVTYMFQYCLSLASITLPDSWGSVTTVGNMFQNCYSLASITLPTSWGSVTNVTYMFNTCYSLASITLPDSWGSVTTVGSMFQNCYSLASITNLEYLGSQTVQSDFTDILRDCEFLQTPLVIASRLSKIGIYGVNGYNLKVTSVRLTNVASTFTGSSPQVNVSYTDLGQAALVELFNDLPTLTSKTINITGCTGAAALTAAERLIATGKGWTITG